MQNKYHENPDLLVRTGSHLYGTNVQSSDIDTRGFAIPSAEILLGRGNWEQYESKEPDCVIWNISKFILLLEKSSPNTIEILFAPKKDILICSDAGSKILQNRHLFITKEIFKPMSGFAFSEIKKDNFKNKCHAIRLLDQCHEILSTGAITYPRPNAAYLLKIRSGEISPEEIQNKYLELDNALVDVYNSSSLPENQDKSEIDKLYFDLIRNRIKDFVL